MPTPLFRLIPCLAALLSPLLIGSVLPGAEGSSEQARPHVILPPASGGTHLSFQIQAEAISGSTWRSGRVGGGRRRINADAVAREIENSIDYVDAFFKRRELNRQYRAQENPNYLQAEQYRQQVRRQRLESQFQDVLKGNLTDQLNWLLTEVSGPMLAYQYLSQQTSLADTELNPQLDDQDLEHIWLSDGGPSGRQLVISAGNSQVLETRWPLSLRHPQLDDLRAQLEASRDQLLAELASSRQISYTGTEQLTKHINDMLVAIERIYPEDQRQEFAVFTAYSSGKRYLRSLAAQTHRVAETSDKSLLNGSLRFEGGHLLDLIQYMDRTGLVFAPPQAGGERVYRSLLSDMRNIWLMMENSNPS